MSFIAFAMIGGTAAVAGGLIAANGAKKAGAAQAAASNEASQLQMQSARESNALQKEMFDKQIALNAPFRDAGLAGQNRLMTLLGIGGKEPEKPTSAGNVFFGGFGGMGGFTADPGLFAGVGEGAHGDRSSADFGKYAKDFSMGDFQEDPGYQFRMQQGQQALERSAAARGGLLSGRAGKDMTSYAQSAASQEYGNAFNRYQTNRSNQLNPLQSLAGMSQTASGAMSGAAGAYGANVGNNLTSTANTVGNNMMGAGNARASGYVGQANAVNSAIGGGASAFQNYNMMNKMFPSAPGITDGGYSMGMGSAYGGLRAGL